jgi:ATP-dependent protease ClpP protease subunit
MTAIPVVPQRVYVSFSAEINAHTTESLLAVMANQVNAGVPEVYLLLSTPGGAVMNGMNVYNALRAFPFKLITHNVGNVDSIGNAIFLAGQTRYACAHSTFMFHGVASGTAGVQALDARALRERLAGVAADEKRIGSIIEQRTKLDHRQVVALFREQRTKDATYAVGAGIVDEIRDVQIPVGGPVISLVFNR